MQRKIGDPVWIFNPNHRVYADGKSGPVWRQHWVKKEIVGETSRSWVVGRGFEERKIPKSGNMPTDVCWSEEEINRRAFVHDHSYRIGNKVQRLDDYDTLKKVAELIGYTAEL